MHGGVLPAPPDRPLRRRGKEWRERFAAALLLVPAAPVLGGCAAAIAVEGLLDPAARGPVLFREARISRGRVITLLKLRTLSAAALRGLGEGPTHIALLEKQGQLTRVGRVIRQWYLDELPQLWNVVRGDIFLIGTRPYPVELYLEEMARGVTRKRDMPAGLIGPVQSLKGDARMGDPVARDAEYWEAFRRLSAGRLFLLDLRIVGRSLRVQLRHGGI